MKTIIKCLKNIVIRTANATYTVWEGNLGEKYTVIYLYTLPITLIVTAFLTDYVSPFFKYIFIALLNMSCVAMLWGSFLLIMFGIHFLLNAFYKWIKMNYDEAKEGKSIEPIWKE